jgi:glycosyltransferase involved in cell wall biosynthesis
MTMFSVLLPTRNRLEYLRYAIETVRRQDYSDWEIIVSDNFSEDNIGEYIASLAEPRIVYRRTDKSLPVTDNWNNALDQSSGRYIVMLGDDDGLLPGYFSNAKLLIDEFESPDFIYSSALFFAYPGVMPDAPLGFLRHDKNAYLNENRPFLLDRARSLAIAKGYLAFRMPVASNMQFSLISRDCITRLRSDGVFFHSPYPDFYATPALFLTSKRILIDPAPRVIIGITPKSYGFFHFNNQSEDGVAFLNNSSALEQDSGLARIRLPGTSYNDSWLRASEALHRRHSHRYGLEPQYKRYRLLQIVHCFKRCYFDHSMKRADIDELLKRMTIFERLAYGIPMRIGFSLLRFVPMAARKRTIAALRRLIGQHAISETEAASHNFATLLQVFESRVFTAKTN